MKDYKESLFAELITCLINKCEDLESVKNEIFVVLNGYDVSKNCTEIAIYQGDRNEELVKKFIMSKIVKGCSKRTIEYYSKEIPKILNSIGKVVDDINADDIRYYLAVRQTRDKISKTTADNELRCLRTFFEFLLKEEILNKNVTLKIDRIKPDKKQKKAFTELEIEKMRNSVKTKREKAMLEVFLSTGCRASEASGIKIEEIKEDRIVIFGKGGKERTVYLNAKAQVAIAEYLAERSDNNPYLFCCSVMADGKGNLGRMSTTLEWYKNPQLVHPQLPAGRNYLNYALKSLGKRCGVKAHAHKFRRTCATLALRHGMPIEQVGRMLGHENLATTQIYLDLSEEELQQAHKKFVI